MVQEQNKQLRSWQQIAREASQETDPVKLCSLIEELDRVLDGDGTGGAKPSQGTTQIDIPPKP